MSRSIIVNRNISTVAISAADGSAVFTLDCGHPVNQTASQVGFVNLVSQLPCPRCEAIAATAQGLPA